MKAKGIFLNDLRMARNQEAKGKAHDHEKMLSALDKAIDGYVSNYNTSKKTPLERMPFAHARARRGRAANQWPHTPLACVGGPAPPPSSAPSFCPAP